MSSSRAQPIITAILITAFTGVFLSCGQNNGDKANDANLTGNTNNPSVDTTEYLKSEKTSQFGRLESYQIVPKVYQRLSQELQHQSLKGVQLSKDFNTDIYVIGEKRPSKSAVLKPQVLLQSSLEGKRVYPKEQKDGTILVDVSIAFLDGLSPIISTGFGSRQVPQEFLIKDKESFLAELERDLRAKPNFLTSIPCPSNISIHSQVDGEFPIQFHSKLRTCPLNTFFPAQLVLRKREWQSLVESFLREGSLELTSKIDLSSPLVEGIHLFSLSTETLLKELQTRVVNRKKDGASRTPFSLDEVKAVTEELLSDILRSFQTSVSPEYLKKTQDELIGTFFLQLDQSHCFNENGRCYGLKEVPDANHKEFQFQFIKEAFFGSPLIVHIQNPISDLMAEKKPVLIQSNSSSLLSPPEQSETNLAFKSLKEGEVLEIKVDKLRLSEIGWDQPKEELTKNPVCIRPYDMCTNGKWNCSWRQIIHGINGKITVIDMCEKYNPPAPPMPKLPYRVRRDDPYDPAMHFQWECIFRTTQHCDDDAWQDQWKRVTSWSIPTLNTTWKEKEFKNNDWKEILGSVGIRFQSVTPSGVKETLCQISDLEFRILPPDRLILVARNTAACPIFTDENRVPGYEPSISFQSRVTFPSQFRCGNMVEEWNGKRTYSCTLPDGSQIKKESTLSEDQATLAKGGQIGIWRSYYPRAEIQGQLRIVGSFFQTKKEDL